MNKIFLRLVTLMVVGAMLSAGAYALFFDTEISSGDTLGASTLDLKVNDEDGAVTLKFEESGIAPGYDSGYKIWCLKNTGTEPGQPSVEFSSITNDENSVIEDPETIAENESYARAEGELGQYLKYVIGVGPCNWTVPSLLTSQWQTGPVHPWGTPGLDSLAGNEYFKGPTGYKFPVLNQDQTYGFFMKTTLDEDLERSDGTKWLDVDDNIIQSDGVEFDITFKLEQVTP